LSEPLRSEPGITRIFSADISQIANQGRPTAQERA
jgi:hypothetical protein